MNLRHPILQAAALVLLAVVCALAANASADRQRQLVLVGHYPNALRVPSRSGEPASPPVAAITPVATQSTATVAPVATESVAASAAPVVSPPAPATSSIAAVRPAPATATATAAKATSAPGPKASPPVTATTAPATASFDPSRFAPHPDKAFVEIAYRDVAALHDAGALFLDARRTSVYEQGHIAGARSISVWEADLEEKVRKLFDERSDPREQAKVIVAYCSGGDCEDSHMLAEKLWGIQFNNVYVYKDGFPDWQKHGGAVHQGSNP